MVFASAAESFAALVRRLPGRVLGRPGSGRLGRARAGRPHLAIADHGEHSTCGPTAQREDVTSAADYYAWVHEYSVTAGAAAIVERGRQAGRDLGEDPVATIDALVPRVLAELDEPSTTR